MGVSVNPLITCIIPTRNRPELVTRAVKSVLNQSYGNYEIIVIDDSTDNLTQEIFSSSGRKLKYIKNEICRGAQYSRNIGLSEAKGDIISFLDDDDFWMPWKIESQMKLIHNSPIVGCNYIAVYNNGKCYVSLPPRVSFEKILYYNYLGSCSFVIISADIVKGFFFDESIKAGQDWDYWISLMKQRSISEAANAQSYLVEYNCGNHQRISTSQEAFTTKMTIYNKYQNEYNDKTSKLFYLYNMLSAENSFFLGLLREYAKARLNSRGLFFLIKNILNKNLFNHYEIY